MFFTDDWTFKLKFTMGIFWAPFGNLIDVGSGVSVTRGWCLD